MHYICEGIHIIVCECVCVHACVCVCVCVCVQPEALSAEWLCRGLLRVNLAICLRVDSRLKPCSLN